MCALRCLTDLIQFSSVHCVDANFEQYWTAFFQVYFQEDLETIKQIEDQRYQQQLEHLVNQTKETSISDDTPKKLKTDEDVEMVQETVKNTIESKKEDSDEEVEKDLALDKLRLVCLETIGKCWPFGGEIQG